MAATFSRDADDMKAETPLMEENPTPKNKVGEQILAALGKLYQRLNSLETRQAPAAQPERHYIGDDGAASAASAASASTWQNLASDRGAEK